ncbi:ejaculatory bulb-specific protein 3-like [Hyposmocoma kahamanoa]|uniref:ejaculatory bulb-specific protein 3-like n=1 Tax=Hyposmocoma kahamanoa TaxID=1477025 RepID=UPI000E6D92EF|nr:ejaculatory bulb-specific protein 3-like [Hyposmocoma kahamanoa]
MAVIRYVVFLSCLIAAAIAQEEKYTDKYDNIDIQEILDNKRLLHSYIDCLMERGKCTAEGKELKEHIVDALETGCEKCTENQQKGTHKVIEHLIKNELPAWKELCKKYDPSGNFRKKYETIAKEKGIEIPEDK